MRKDPLNYEHLFREVDARNQAVLVASDVENQPAALIPKVGSGEGPLERREMRPVGLSRDP